MWKHFDQNVNVLQMFAVIPASYIFGFTANERFNFLRSLLMSERVI